MNTFLDFLSLQDPGLRTVVFGTVLMGAVAGVMGCFTFLRRQALVGDALAHAVLPGVCGGFLVAGTKNPFALLIGAFLTGALALYAIEALTKHTRLKQDAAIALILSSFFGLGILLLTHIQHSGNAAQSGLDLFLFGQAAALQRSDLWAFLGLAFLVFLAVFLFFKPLQSLIFDATFSQLVGLPVRILEALLTALTILAVVIGIQAVGVVLIAALLITPAVTARLWVRDLRAMLFVSGGLGAFSGLAGAYVSYAYPGMPTGPWIVLVASVFAFFSFIVKPKR